MDEKTVAPAYGKIIDAFRGKRILVVGDVILDHYLWGKVERVSPEAPVPVVDVQRETHLLGGAGNVANNIASMGAKAVVAGIVGDDHRAEILLKLFLEKGVDASGVIADKRPTTVKTRIIAHNQQVVRVDREDTSYIGNAAFKRLAGFIRDNIDACDAVIVSDYKKGVVTARMVRFLLTLAGRRELFIAVDPKVGHFNFYKGASLITPNKKEASEGSGVAIRDERSLDKAARVLLSKLRLDAVLITRGDEGMSLFAEGRARHIPTVARQVYDVTGAGDTVIAAFTLAKACGAGLFNAAVMANHAAGIVVGVVGTAAPTPRELIDSFDGK
jgi:D-beta-D-heptose 7-phosphate kinase/D-beta-D-heptose 1-phosphate adenosyltransferase